MANIRIKDLPADGAPKQTDLIPIDLGSTRHATVKAVVESGRPTASKAEAEAGVEPQKAMTPLTTKQAIDSQVGSTYVPKTVKVNAGTGISGGGALSGDVTVGLSAGSVASLAKADSAVQSVNGKSGNTVTIAKGDVGLGNVDNTSDLAKPISTETQTALNAKANSSVTVSAGTGLTGGGNLTANRSIALNSASIASLGKADTALQAPGGTTGQILAKNSNTTNDVGWVSSEAATAVSYGPQTLTEPQKTQARTNIGAASSDQGVKADGAVRFDTTQTLTTAQKTSARSNIGAISAAEVPPAPVTSVNTKTGAVVLSAGDVGAFPSTGGTVTGNIDATGYIQATGDLVTQGNLYVGATNVMTEINAKAGFYAGSVQDEINFPIGHIVTCYYETPIPVRNASAQIRVNPNNPREYHGAAGTLILSGVWRSRGSIGGGWIIMQRIS